MVGFPVFIGVYVVKWHDLVSLAAADQHRCVLRPLTEKGRRGRPASDILQRALQDDYINATVVNVSFTDIYFRYIFGQIGPLSHLIHIFIKLFLLLPSLLITAFFPLRQTGYHEFIATPHPLPGTVPDFWRMVVQTQASSVVMFHAARADQVCLLLLVCLLLFVGLLLFAFFLKWH